jgi:N-formylglutamate deformylase
MSDWLSVHRGEAPLIVSIPHAGTQIPAEIEAQMVSPWLARADADWYVNYLYSFAHDLGATVVATAISRSVIDVNRDPSGKSLYPGQATTGLCPTTTFDGVKLYRGAEPDAQEIAARRLAFFEPYHAALAAEVARLRALHPRVVLYDAHSIRSKVPRLFEGALPVFNIGTNNGASCDPRLTAMVEAMCKSGAWPTVVNGRFKGGWITRHYGRPADGVHAIQMELAMRAYLREPREIAEANWPPPYIDEVAALIRPNLGNVLRRCLAFAKETP